MRAEVGRAILFLQHQPQNQDIHHVAHQVIPVCVAKDVADAAQIRQRIKKRGTIDAEHSPIACPFCQDIQQLHRKANQDKGQDSRGVVTNPKAFAVLHAPIFLRRRAVF